MVETPRYRLQEAMVTQIERSLRDADIALALFDYSQPDGPIINRTVQLARSTGKRCIFALNKIDLATDELDLSPYPEGTIPISALEQINMRSLGDAIAERLPEEPFLYPPDVLATQPERFFVAELVRETVFDLTRKEVPYTSAVAVEQFIERRPKDYVQATIYVEHDSQKGIMIGHRGAHLKRIGEVSRRKIEEFLGRPVYLELYVKVKQDWMKRDSDLRELGYLEG
jgi:GTP-binding protein Era